MLLQKVVDCASDRFRTQVYYAEALNLFVLIDAYAGPSARDFVVVRDAFGLALESFRGQSFIGVARKLNFYQLVHSDQEISTNLSAYPD